MTVNVGVAGGIALNLLRQSRPGGGIGRSAAPALDGAASRGWQSKSALKAEVTSA